MKLHFLACLSFFLNFAASAENAKFVVDSIYNPAIGDEKNVALIYFGGSEGGLPTWEDMNFQKEVLPSMGIATLGVAYFGSDHTPQSLEQLPLEYWEEVLQTFTSLPEIKGKKQRRRGRSRGYRGGHRRLRSAVPISRTDPPYQ